MTYCPHCSQVREPHTHRRVAIFHESQRVVVTLAPAVHYELTEKGREALCAASERAA
jgi:hypothetical protein